MHHNDIIFGNFYWVNGHPYELPFAHKNIIIHGLLRFFQLLQ